MYQWGKPSWLTDIGGMEKDARGLTGRWEFGIRMHKGWHIDSRYKTLSPVRTKSTPVGTRSRLLKYCTVSVMSLLLAELAAKRCGRGGVWRLLLLNCVSGGNGVNGVVSVDGITYIGTWAFTSCFMSSLPTHCFPNF